MQQSFSSWDAALSSAASQAVGAGDPYAARDLYENAIRQGADDPTTLGNYGVLLWRLFEFREADEALARVVKHPQADAATLRRVAQCYFEVGRFGKAVAVMRAAVARMSELDAPTANSLAWVLERDHQIDEARQVAEAAHALDPAYGPAVRLLAHLDRRAGDLHGAAQRIERQLRRFQGDSDWGLRYELAAVRDQLGCYDEAWAALCEAKAQLAAQSAEHLKHSYAIRQRQWELAQSVTPADLRRWRHDGSALTPRNRIVFLTGFPRSGTTLLEQIIATNPDTVGTDESGILANHFTSPIVWRAADTMDAVIELRSFDVDQLMAGRETFFQMTESYLDEPISGRLLIEKSPLQTADMPLALRMFPEGRWLVALRDPRDVVLSYLFTLIPLNWTSAAACDVVQACRYYADTMRHRLWWRDRLDWPAYETVYERLIADPSGESRRIAEFLGLEWNPSMLDERQRSERKAVRTPTYIDVTKPLYAKSIGRWRNYRQYLAPGLDILRPFVTAFGYDE